jgi:hypothetical protein
MQIPSLGAALVLLACACDAPAPVPARAERGSVAAAKSPAAPTPSSSAAEPSVPPVRNAKLDAERWVAIGDLHGDLAATREVFQLAGAIDSKDRWIGGDLVVVQTGDQLDRGDDEQAILDLLESLTAQAKAAGGALVTLNGNHETMNALLDFRYVTKAGISDFDGAGDQPLPSQVAQALPPELAGRASAFLPGGPYARVLAKRPLVAVVGDTLFAHGGVHLEHARYGIDKLNDEARVWLEGKQSSPPRLVLDERGPLWSRSLGAPTPSAAACADLSRTLAALGVKRLVIGHTIQEQINSACDGRVWRIDVGMSAHYGSTHVAALAHEAGKLRVLSRPKSGAALPAAAE